MELLPHLDTERLKRIRADLAHPMPGDGTFLATVGSLLRELVSREIAHPDRAVRDIETQGATLEARHKFEQDALGKKHDEQQAALPAAAPLAAVDQREVDPKAQAALDDKQAAEQEALAKQQAAEVDAFHEKHGTGPVAANDNRPVDEDLLPQNYPRSRPSAEHDPRTRPQ